MDSSKQYLIDASGLAALFALLRREKYDVVGPTVRDGAIVYDRLESPDDLPVGCGDEQEAGYYRLRRRADRAYFGYNLGPHSWKEFLFPVVLKLFSAARSSDGLHLLDGGEGGTAASAQGGKQSKTFAFVGVRPCELSALRVHDKIFSAGPYADPRYGTLRRGVFVVAVNCSQAAATCFCASMGTGPSADSGFDLCLTELRRGEGSLFVVRSSSTAGDAVLQEIPHRPATDAETTEASNAVRATASSLKREIETAGLQEALRRHLDHPRWDLVAKRCLTCANCTMVCPTCFCSTVEDTTDLGGDRAERWRRWDSCFTLDFSYIHGGSIRSSPRSRYRQWLTHKLSSWYDQFGSAGCVGCGRCITWCPVGIDITEEARVLREAPRAAPTINEREE